MSAADLKKPEPLLPIYVLMLLNLAGSATAQTIVAEGPARTHNATMLEIDGRRVVLSGIDGPHLRQYCTRNDGSPYPCGRDAAKFLGDAIDGKTVVCHLYDPRAEERGRCFVGDSDIALKIIDAGYAVTSKSSSRDVPVEQYSARMATARSRRLGIWAGSFVDFETWRANASTAKVMGPR